MSNDSEAVQDSKEAAIRAAAENTARATGMTYTVAERMLRLALLKVRERTTRLGGFISAETNLGPKPAHEYRQLSKRSRLLREGDDEHRIFLQPFFNEHGDLCVRWEYVPRAGEQP